MRSARTYLVPSYKEKFPEVIDSVHRLGRKNPARTQPHDFLQRHFHDMIWKRAKMSDYLKQSQLCFKEDLTQKNKQKKTKEKVQLIVAKNSTSSTGEENRSFKRL